MRTASLDTRLRITSLITSGIGLAALIITDYIPIDLKGLVALVFMLGMVHQFFVRVVILLPRLLSLATFVLSLIHALGSDSFFVLGASGLLLSLIIYKLFNLEQLKDHWQLFVLGFLSILLASILTVSFSYFAFLLGFIIAAIANLILLTISQNIVAGGVSLAKQRVNFKLSGLIGLFTFLLIPLSFLLFFMLPRIAQRAFSIETLRLNAVTGFSEQVKLGDVGEITLGSNIVFRAQITGATPEQLKVLPLYWRGIALDYYENGRWRANSNQTERLVPNPEGRAFLPTEPLGFTVGQEIILEPLGSRYLIGLDRFVGIKLDEAILKDGTDSLLLGKMPTGKIGYTAYSRPEVLQEAELNHLPNLIPPNHLVVNTQLPKAFPSSVHQLAEQVTFNTSTQYERVRAIEKYLLTNFHYTLDRKPKLAGNPLEDFLFHSREGHCELFATAMVLMLRSLQIPARLVNGFYGGEYNPVGNYFLIREAQAHAWVEVLFPQVGWVRFDPSPQVVGIAMSQVTPSAYQQYWDAMKFSWYRWVIRYSHADQMRVLNKAQEFSHFLQKGLIPSEEWSAEFLLRKRIPWVVAALVLLLLPLLYFMFRRIRHASGQRAPLARERRQLQTEWHRLLRLLDKKGYDRSPHQTLQHFMEHHALEDSLGSLIPYYERLRYGRCPPTNQDVEGLRRRINQSINHLQTD